MISGCRQGSQFKLEAILAGRKAWAMIRRSWLGHVERVDDASRSIVVNMPIVCR